MINPLLTPTEQKPYVHCHQESYGDVSLTICDVDTEGLLKAQLVAVVKWLEELNDDGNGMRLSLTHKDWTTLKEVGE